MLLEDFGSVLMSLVSDDLKDILLIVDATPHKRHRRAPPTTRSPGARPRVARVNTYMIQHSEPAEPVQDRMGYGAMGMGRRTPDLNCLSDLQNHLKGFKTKLEPVKGVLSPLLLSH
jgi:hypothetical protein